MCAPRGAPLCKSATLQAIRAETLYTAVGVSAKLKTAIATRKEAATMTPEERYAKIDERIEAIAMHLELTTAMVVDNEKRAEQWNAEIKTHIDRIVGLMESLTHASLDHRARIERLEGN